MKSKKKNLLLKISFGVIVAFFGIFLTANIISQQAQIAGLRKETASISKKITQAEQKRDEYTSLLKSDEKEYMQKAAVEKFGYAYPNERRFYVVNKNSK